jgi:hypothetical protein
MDAVKIVSHPKAILSLALGVVALLTGCRSPDIYYWGHYENLVYISYTKPDKATPELQARTMEEDVQKAAAAGKPLPPGFHAHLGDEYYQMGKFDLAVLEFQKEKELFPESTVFMDRLIATASKR